MHIFNNVVVSLIPLTPKPIVARFARPYIAGERLSDAVATVRRLNNRGARATIDVLGENITTREEAIAAREECKRVLNEISHESLDANLSIKLTQLGLKIDKHFCQDNVEEVLHTAKGKNNFVRIDMEDHTCTDDTLEIFYNVRKKYDAVGVVIQAYLKRSEEDVKKLAATGANVRLCKGIYIEPAQIAFKERREIQQNYIRLLKLLLTVKCYVGIATHDDVLIDGAARVIQDLSLTDTQYEFQMLLGVRTQRRIELIRDGHKLRVYTPFGKKWYAYSVRRLKENPEIAGYVLKALFESKN